MLLLPLLFFTSTLFLVRANPDPDPDPNPNPDPSANDRVRRAPTSSIPSIWGTKTIKGTTVPFGRWEHSTQCTHLINLQSAIELPWDVDNHLPSGSTVTIDIIARIGSLSTYPRDSPAFYLWADGKMLEVSQGTKACPSDKNYSDCFTDPSIAKLVSFPIPSTIKKFAILPVSGKCQQSVYRIKTKIPGVCGNDRYRIPLDPITNNPIQVLPDDAKSTCASMEAELAKANWKNLVNVGDVAYDCLGPDGKTLIHSWNGDNFDQSAIQIYLGAEKSFTASVNMADGDPHPPICSIIRQSTYGQELASNIRVIRYPPGVLREQAASLCQSSGYGLADLNSINPDTASDIQDALWELKLADGNEGTGWIRSMDNDQYWDSCVALSLDATVNGARVADNPDESPPTLIGHVVKEDCDATKLTAIICQKPEDLSLVDMLRSAL